MLLGKKNVQYPLNRLLDGTQIYKGHSEKKEHFAIQRYLLIIGKKKNMQVLSHLHLLLHIVTLDIEALVIPWHQFTYSLLVPEGRLAILQYCKCLVTISYTTVWDTSGHCSYTSLNVKCRFSRMMQFNFCFNASAMTEGCPDLSVSWTSVRPFLNIVHHFWTLAAFITCSP